MWIIQLQVSKALWIMPGRGFNREGQFIHDSIIRYGFFGDSDGSSNELFHLSSSIGRDTHQHFAHTKCDDQAGSDATWVGVSCLTEAYCVVNDGLP
mmetsp:Transcript_27425/g.57834  ORF Transcript_27425/g.57834 Transcript_27425/m.57834 type:complete len:96 (-) Transcript_27425:442-729(-)